VTSDLEAKATALSADAEEKSDSTPTEAKDVAEETTAADKEKAEAEAKSAAEEAKKAAAAAKEAAEAAKAETEKKDAKAEAKEAEKPAAEKPATDEAAKKKTFTVEAKRLKIELPLDGTFVAREMEEIAFRPEAWTDYEIVEVVPHGEKVHKGQVLFKFDSEKLDDAIEDLELEQRLNELAIVKAEEEMPRIEKTLKMDYEEAERTNRETKEDFKRYTEVDRPLALKSAEFMIKYYNFNLDYEKDELDQLEKMYKADDLTEDTEEIVLKRQRNAVEFAEFSLENARTSSEEMINIRIPRMDIRMRDALERAALGQARAKMALNLDLDRTRYELEQRKVARKKSLERHTKLLADRELMEIKAPADGIAFYGQSVNGRWADTATLINKYKPHNNVTGGSVLMTIVKSRPLYITSQLEEGKRPEVSEGAKAKIVLPAEGSDRLDGQLKSISPIPVGANKFEVNFDVKQDAIPDWVAAGMNCKIQVNTYDKKDALVVPKKAVHDEEDNPDEHFVWLVDPKDTDAKPQKRVVKLGKRKGEEVEIVKGLKKGDVISLDDEDAKKKEATEEKKTE
jgi:multidrug efflux pump subunit AcrA (membrane-fusion protein)